MFQQEKLPLHTLLQPYSENKVALVRGKLFCPVKQKISNIQVLSFSQLYSNSLIYALDSYQQAGLLCDPRNRSIPDRTLHLRACMFCHIL